MAKPTVEELRYRLYFGIVDMIGSIFHVMVPWTGAVLVAFFFYKSVVSLAGQYTFAQIGATFLGDFKISDGLAYVFGGSGVAYGLRHRKLPWRQRREDGGPDCGTGETN